MIHRRRSFVTLGLAAITSAIVLIVGGCTPNDQDRRPQVSADAAEPSKSSDDRIDQRLLGDGFEIDLAERPSAEDLGLQEGDTIRVRNLPEERTFAATVHFDGGDTLNTPANVLTVTAGAGGRPVNFQLIRHEMDLVDVREALTSAVDTVGLSKEDRSLLLGVAERAGDDGGFQNRTYPADPSGDDGLEVNLLVDGEDEFHLIYTVTLTQAP